MKTDTGGVPSVSVTGCRSFNYEYDEIRAAILRSFENIGGITEFVQPGERVLLKVNLVMKKKPEAAATSHPVFVQAMADLLREQGASVVIGDSPGGLFNEMRLRSIYQTCGMSQAAERSSAALNFNTGSSEVENPQGKLLKKLVNVDMLRDVDKVINLSKLKTHGMMRMTGAVKNLFGTIPGTLKAEYHLNRPEPDQFAEALIDICLCAKPAVSFVDGIVAMEGDGPTSGTPRNVGVVLASADPFVLDLICAYIIGVEPETVPTVKCSIQRGLCPENIEAVMIHGEDVTQFRMTDFTAPTVKLVNPLSGDYPKWIQQLVNYYGQPRPVFLHQLCIGCEDCYRNCPPKAISMEKNRPDVDLKQCIRCFCCQELCPKKAVEIKRPLLFRMISRL